MSRSTLSALDTSLYPQVWRQQTVIDPQNLLMALLTGDIEIDPKEFTKLLLKDTVYQEWINATVFGRYIQRSFTAFYRQTEDSFNMDMPALFRRELMRHAQFLPINQILFVAGDIPKSARLDKLFTTTVNPATALDDAQKISQNAVKSGRLLSQEIIINKIKVAGKQVVGFPIRHNKRTSERTRNEVLILDFNDLRLVSEEVVEASAIKKSNTAETILLRYYELR
ncbi:MULTISPECIES: hypothetical protein [unclassified Psychrobacter]|uniref:hypothetical protein n=1 Tax=unclassified Psychrobacter TaxID=196806 RepID=UPI003FD4FD48